MPRGRRKQIHEQVSINGEPLQGCAAVLEQSTEEKDAKIFALEARLRAFEDRLEKAMGQPKDEIVPSYNADPERALPFIKNVTTRDMFEAEDRKPVYGTFRMTNKKPGEKGIVKIGALRKYKGDHMRPWVFEHGKNYTVPKWLADWLNGGETPDDDKVKSPRCNIIKHNDQWNDLQNKTPLSSPTKMPMFSFTPVVNW